jgi:hypothetical protein
MLSRGRDNMDAENESFSELVVRRSYRRVIMYVVFGLIVLGAFMLMSSEPAEAYTVTGTEVWSAPTVWFEDVTIASGGDLTIQNTEVYMAPSFDGEYNFMVQSGGTLTVTGSTITTFLGPYYGFGIESGSTVSFISSEVSYVGGPLFPGMFVFTSDITMNGLSIINNQMIGMYYASDVAGFTMTNCYVANNPSYGVYIAYNWAPDYYFTFNGGTVIENNLMAGIYVDIMSTDNFGLTLQDVTIQGHEYGIYLSEINNGLATLDFRSSNLVNNPSTNVWINNIINTDLTFSAFNTHFDRSAFGYGIFISNVDGTNQANLTMSMDSSYVMGNGDSGIYVARVVNGWMTYDFVNTYVDLNNGLGLYTPQIAPDRTLSFTAVGSSFSGNLQSGLLLSGANPGRMSVTVDNCDFFNNGVRGMEILRVTNGDKIVTVTNSWFDSNLAGDGAIVDWGIYNGTFDYFLGGNEFNNSYAAVYFADSIETFPGYGHTMDFVFIQNWLDSGTGEYGLFFLSPIQYFDQTTMVFAGNHFYGREARDYGIYFDNNIRGDPDYVHTLGLVISGNEFIGLDQSGAYFGGGIYWFQMADIIMSNNYFEDANTDFNYGFYFNAIYNDVNEDAYLTIDSDGNQFLGITDYAYRFNIWGIRHVFTDFTGNTIVGFGTTLQGILFDNLNYGATGQASDLTMNFNGNTFVWMQASARAINIETGAGVFFRCVDISLFANVFNATGDGALNHGLYLYNDFFYTTSEIAYFNLTADNNEFLDLQYAGIQISNAVYSYANVRLEYTNNLFDGSNLWMDFGIIHSAPIYFSDDSVPSSFTFTLLWNRFYDQISTAVHYSNVLYGFRDVMLVIEYNDILNRVSNYMDYGVFFPGGLYYSSNDYDNHYTVVIRHNTIRDMLYQGIYFSSSSSTYGFRHVDIQIQNNVIENIMSPTNMDYGIIWYYEIFYQRNDVGSSFDLDITGNHFQDLDEDAVAFKYNAGWDFGYFNNATISIWDNEFINTVSNYMRYGLYLRPVYSFTTTFDNSVDIAIVNNTCDSLNDYCIHFSSNTGYDFEGYRNAAVTISRNNFRNTLGNWMDYGVYLHGFGYSDSNYYSNFLDMVIYNNNIENLTAYGVYFHGYIHGYSVVDIDIIDNYFSDVYGDFDRGVYFPNDIYYYSDNEGAFYFTSLRNRAHDLLYDAIRINGNVYNFRNATVLVQDCEFFNAYGDWMDHGVYLRSIYYGNDMYDNYFDLDILNNRFENLSWGGFRMDQIYYYAHVDINIVNNHFSDIYGGFDYGVYFGSNIYHSPAYDGSFTVTIVGNTVHDLITRGVHFSSDIMYFRNVWITIDNNDFGCHISDWLDDGVYFYGIYYDDPDYVSNFRLDVTNNNFENLSYAGLRIDNWVSYRYVLINVINNQFTSVYSGFDYGIRFEENVYGSTMYDSDLEINVLDNTLHDMSNTGIRFGQFYDFRNATITIDNNNFINTLSNWMDYGLYISEVEYDGYPDLTNFYLAVTNNNFENLTRYGFTIYDIYNYRYTTVDVLNNFMSDRYGNFDIGLYIGDDIGLDDTSYDGEFRINILNNEVWNLDWWAVGIYVEDVYNFRWAWITADNNNFYNDQQYERTGYGIYFDVVYFESDAYDTYLWANFTDNHFESLNDYGIAVYEVYGFRHVYMDFLDNSFSDLHNSFNYGIYTYYIYYDTDYDSDLTINIIGNTFMNLYNTGYYCYELYDFRTMWITVEYNTFTNTISNWMDYGVYFDYIYYDDTLYDSYLYVDMNHNNFESLDDAGFYISEIWDIRNVMLDFHWVTCSDIYDSFENAIYVGTTYYTTSYAGVFYLYVTNNTLNDLTQEAFYMGGVDEFRDTDIIVQDNDFSGSDYGFYLDYVDYAYDWYFSFTRNNGDYMYSYMLYIEGSSYGEQGFSQAQIFVTYNTMSYSWDGFYIGDIYYYDLSAGIMIDNNDLLNMYTGYGIELGWFGEDPGALFLIRDNTITGKMWAAIYLSGCEDMAFVMDIIGNTIYGARNAIYLDEPVYGDDSFTVGDININQNDIQGLRGSGIYIGYVYYGLMDLTVESNLIRGDPVAYFGVTFFRLDYADWNSISNIDLTNNDFENGFYGIYFDYQGSGSMITLDVYNTDITNTYYTFYFDDPVSSSSDVFSVKISKSTYTNSQLSFFYINDPGYGLFIVDITDCHVLNYGSLGGYGFYMADNDGAFVRIDVYSTEFVGSSSRLGDAFAGDGQILINFWYIDGITSGVANGWNQRIQVLWDVDVQVYIGSDYTTDAGPGIVVFVEDQFGYMSFYTTTNGEGMVPDQTVAGVLITYSGSSFSGQAVHTFWATQGPFSGSAIGTFNANGTISILLPGDSDGDGLHDGIDIDDDNDGVPDVYDAFPYNDLESKDTDGDGIGDNEDEDDDGDGVLDTADAFPDNPKEWSDLDGDGVGDNTDIDIDGDGIPNIVDSSPYNNTGLMDSDGDGVADSIDVFPYSPSEWADNDGDGMGDNSDEDDDNDGVPDTIDLYPYDDQRTEIRTDKETTVNVGIGEGMDWTAPLAIIIIGVILMVLMWFLFGPKKRKEEEPLPEPKEEEMPEEEELEPPEEEGLEEPEDLEEEELEEPEDVF